MYNARAPERTVRSGLRALYIWVSLPYVQYSYERRAVRYGAKIVDDKEYGAKLIVYSKYRIVLTVDSS